MYKNNSRDSSKFSGYNTHQLSCNLIGKYHEVGYYSYTYRWAKYKITHRDNISN